MMIGFELVEGPKLEGAIERLFADPRAAYLHIHYAAPGCYAARVERAWRAAEAGGQCRPIRSILRA